MSKKTTCSAAGQALTDLIRSGLDAKKCRRCGKMAGVIDNALRAFEASDDPEAPAMAGKIGELRKRTLKQASNDFGCSGCWGSKARKELAQAFKVPKAKKSKSKAEPLEIIEAATPRPLRRDKNGTMGLEIVDGSIKCVHYAPSGKVAHVVTGRDAIAIVAAVAEAGLVDRIESAAYLGWELARAEAAIASSEPYAAQPWPLREKRK